MPAFSPGLERALQIRRLTHAKERRHEYATLEHLLLALIDDQDAAAVMRACNVNVRRTAPNTCSATSTRNSTIWSLDMTRTPSPRQASSASSTPVIHVQSSAARKSPAQTCSSRSFAERESHAASSPGTADDALRPVNYIKHGHRQASGATEAARPRGAG